ncbi:carbohydrate sulfotransferase 1-like [Haliotis rubra]|uniref:carbohydrate sulfotransferase 1-like n=1 Tax=Haliotis rubra TaxID=36100 RepID=UPI001EE5978E|nr:carbohydrate sulfotransferase 1-like [Haliotis rubra]
MRSGSTFTSELFQTHPDVFFMFEPFHTTWYYRPKIIPYLHKYKRIYFDDLEKFLTDVKIDTLDKLLRCQFKNLDILTLIQEHWHDSITTKAYKLCTVEQIGVAGIENCLPILTDACSRAKVNFIKTINLTIHQAEPFIDKDPNLKLIYLVRDPRAVLSSQMRYGEFAPSAIDSYSKTFCGIMLKDIQSYAKLKKTHPNQVTFVRYEDIAHKPIPLTEDLYNFVGLPLTQNVRKHIYNITTGGNDEDCPLCISKSNSTQAAEKWRLQAKDDFVQIVDSNCKNVYQYIGYLPIMNASSLRDMNVPVLTVPAHELML